MKKIISLVLVLVLIFSMAVPSYASEIEPLAGDHGSELDALNDIDYWVYWIWSDFTKDLTSIDNWLKDIWTSLAGQDIAFKLTGLLDFTLDVKPLIQNISDEITKLRTNLVGDIAFIRPAFSQITEGLNSIVEVLADPEDVALKESQEENQELITENFFSPGSDTSISSDDITGFAGSVGDFFSAFDTSEIVGDGNPLDLIGDGSDFSRWFSTENGLSMDPNFGSGIGGGGTGTPPVVVNPFQGTNVLPYATSNLVTGTIYNGIGYKNYSAFTTSNIATPERDVYSDYLSTTGYIEVSAGDTIYVVNMDFTTGSIKQYYGSDLNKEIFHVHGFDFTDFFSSFYVDENGVFKWTVSDMETESILAVRFESALISKATYITINEYPLKDVEVPEEPEPEPDPIINWLPLATTEPGGTEILNGIGYLPNYRWSNSAGGLSPYTGLAITGYIPVSSSDTIYLYDLGLDTFVQPSAILFVDGGSNMSIYSNNIPVDENGVFSIRPSSYVADVRYFRLVFDLDNASTGLITINQYPIPETNSVSTFSLRASAPEYEYSPDIATSYYEDRMKEFYNLLGGGN